MSPTIQELGIDRLSAAHRLQLLGEIWDSLTPEETPIPESHRAELDKRIASADADPGAGKPWEEVRSRLWSAQ